MTISIHNGIVLYAAPKKSLERSFVREVPSHSREGLGLDREHGV